MLHKFLEEGDWFAAKRYGYGAGLPIAWQGWALLAAYMGAVLVLCLLAERGWPQNVGAFAGIAVLTVAFVVIVHRHTRGGWRWRWGADD